MKRFFTIGLTLLLSYGVCFAERIKISEPVFKMDINAAGKVNIMLDLENDTQYAVLVKKVHKP